MKTLLLATRNAGKQKEMQELLRDAGWKVLSLRDFPDCPEVEETGHTFLDNARKKAQVVSEHSGLLALADDSGLEVDALGQAPGVFSARYARGESSTDEENINRVLAEMQGIPETERAARFVCAAVLARGDAVVFSTVQTVEGILTVASRGAGGFGYDPIFFYPPDQKTFAELSSLEKNGISHRGKAMREVIRFLRSSA